VASRQKGDANDFRYATNRHKPEKSPFNAALRIRFRKSTNTHIRAGPP
jgi:hypothetical protein